MAGETPAPRCAADRPTIYSGHRSGLFKWHWALSPANRVAVARGYWQGFRRVHHHQIPAPGERHGLASFIRGLGIESATRYTFVLVIFSGADLCQLRIYVESF